ncbi:hypothetical protein PW5551_06495 [Petrotoga sp. 9PW.55.5.1]|uniref:GDP-mannose 4,6-dehydratase n=1 Tax=Petrotoga sp. 9PW.55.5.1 TaxID=1308979 RepID=UPI000DC30718|nr:GDP-mannose 4,6-dehydratase [Petrotoga sp. 9PW.55.5.1]RAO99002.1 hypothetical protein PW5551_06495 [Petrotoga sp. 9PW.55.5.1]
MIENYKPLDKNKRYLITGVAGFIGFHLAKRLLDEDCFVIGLDNLNHYYDVNLKKDRLNIIKQYNKFKFYYADLQDKQTLEKIFKENKIEKFIILPEEEKQKISKNSRKKV